MDTVLQLNEFFVEGKNPNISHVLLNITEPSTPQEKEKGYFFAICEIEKADNKYILKTQNIIDEIENEYYETSDQGDKNALEIVLGRINQKSFSIVKDNINLNCLIGVINDKKIIFSFYGKPQILLFYKNKQQYKRIDLLKENSEDEEEEKQIFSQIIEGKISTGDYFYASTSKVEDYFSHDRLQKIISTRPPRQSAEHLERVLKELKNNISFGGMIIHLQKESKQEETINKKPIIKGSSAKSLSGLFSSQKKTANMLSPSFLPKLKGNKSDNENVELEDEIEEEDQQRSAQINSSHLKARITKDPVKTNKIDYQKILSKTIKITGITALKIGKILYWLSMLLLTIIVKIGNFIGKLFLAITNIRNRRQEVLSDWLRSWQNIKENIKRIPTSIKLLIVFSIVVVVILVISIVYIGNKKQKQKNDEQFNASIKQITSNIDSGESSLIYNDTKKAFDILKQAKDDLNKLDCTQKERETICKNTNSTLENMLNKVRKMYAIDATLLIDWSSINSANKADKLSIIDKKIFGFSQNNAELFNYDLLSKQGGKTTVNITNSKFKASATPKENDYSVFVNTDNQLVKYTKSDNSWKLLDADYQNSNANITALFAYSRRIYSLDNANKQIYKHDATNSGFGNGQEWIKDNTSTDLSKAISLSIDGDVFTANSDGTIFKFNNGTKQDYSISGIDPDLKNIDQIWTYYELKYLYILDSTNKRLIVINKEDGTLKKQLTSTKFIKPTSMIVDEPNGTAYILDNNKLYKIDLNL